jgi:hypothetical protein
MMTLRVFILLYVISVAGLYMLSGRGSSPIIMPGDFYIKKAGRTIYVPLGSSLIVSTILLVVFKVVLPGF